MILRHSAKDVWLIGLSLLHTFSLLASAVAWPDLALLPRLGVVLVLTLMNTYSIIILAHLFTHNQWFRSPVLNSAASVLHSFNIGQPMQAYHLSHVRNHHRYHNDRPGPDGQPRDRSSTFAGSTDGDHVGLLRYALLGALVTLRGEILARIGALSPWRRTAEGSSTDRATGTPIRPSERRQMRLEHVVLALALLILLVTRPSWVLFAYLPSFFVALVLVNIQNYFEHFGAYPETRFANSVSHYGRLYNLLTFNDGYHQEHHLRPQAHWTRMEEVRKDYAEMFARHRHVVSPVPAILGFLDRRRERIDRPSPDLATPDLRGKAG